MKIYAVETRVSVPDDLQCDEADIAGWINRMIDIGVEDAKDTEEEGEDGAEEAAKVLQLNIDPPICRLVSDEPIKPDPYETAARAAGWVKAGGYIYDSSVFDSWKAAVSWAGDPDSGNADMEASRVYEYWKECCEGENIEVALLPAQPPVVPELPSPKEVRAKLIQQYLTQQTDEAWEVFVSEVLQQGVFVRPPERSAPEDPRFFVQLEPLGLATGLEGLGLLEMEPGFCAVSYLEMYEGEPRLLLWDDICSPDPTTHWLGGAKDLRRA